MLLHVFVIDDPFNSKIPRRQLLLGVELLLYLHNDLIRVVDSERLDGIKHTLFKSSIVDGHILLLDDISDAPLPILLGDGLGHVWQGGTRCSLCRRIMPEQWRPSPL